VEPVFGQIKERRGLRGFLMRGREKAAAEWQIICLTHNLLKLTRYVIWQGNCDVVAHTTRSNVAVLRITKAIEYPNDINAN
jgi:hypothetical protein